MFGTQCLFDSTVQRGYWRTAEIPDLTVIKIAPFNRYQTLGVVRAVYCSSRRNSIALYTGNDDNIVAALLTTFRAKVDGMPVEKKIAGGPLDQ